MKTIVIIAAVIAVVACAVILLRQGNPEQTSTHDDTGSDTTSERLHGGDDRPAGADVEDMSIGDRSVGGTSQPGADDAPPEPRGG